MSYNPARIVREDLVEASVLIYIQAGLAAVGINQNQQYGLIESFNTNLFENDITESYIAAGFHQNDGGCLWELGSNLRRKIYTFEYWIIGLTAAQGKNLAHQIQQIVEGDLIIPILDVTQPAPYPTIGALESGEHPAKVERAVVGNPLPWQQHLYQVTIPVLDYFYL